MLARFAVFVGMLGVGIALKIVALGPYPLNLSLYVRTDAGGNLRHSGAAILYQPHSHNLPRSLINLETRPALDRSGRVFHFDLAG
jgi:hypothetical protein